MNISYAAPLRLAWARMTRMLFAPFSIEKWLVLGFAAFLSEYFSGTQTGQYSWKTGRGEHPFHVLHRIRDFLREPFWAAIVLWLIAAAVVVAILIIWINSRGKFIFLENVAHERAGIVEPWKRFKRLGNSLFGWSLLYGLLAGTLMIAMSIPLLGTIIAAVRSEEFRLPALGLVVLWVPVIALAAIAIAYFYLFLHSFVVPIMYRHDLTVPAAWARFTPLLSAHPGSFILYGLFVFVLAIALGIACMTLGFATCCVGFILLALPYVGAVIMLPAEIVFRGLGPEFLSQFGAEWNVFPAAAPASTAAPQAPSPGAGA
jgi:hypothetical protein